ncbi:DUF6713 family protein [Fibrella aquatilis]|uniref:Uncharacterized protein n=1 Tax=Fibrella aquatilis TaxID=2817059 RepID=A0A939GBW6_9BACT|nr:DUF6713 family protein [Fibrella aquatilis]MBO0934394.1 hypothetical protein [Fibrella aquatilis]
MALPDHFFFYLALAFIITHEMDAVRCNEHRIFPLTSMLTDRVGYVVFTAVHIPLFVWLFWVLSQPAKATGLMLSLDTFFLVHIGLHLLLYRHPRNEFTSLFSWMVIIGAGLFGLLDLIRIV